MYIEERRSKPADDLITHLIAAEEDGQKLTSDELISTCILLLNAGHEATVHTIGNGAKIMLEHGFKPSWMVEQRAEATIEEVMRYDPPLHLFTRYVYEDVTLMGYNFRRGDEVGCLLASAAHDPTQYDNPGVFDPARDLQPHLSLGAGLHFCVGAPLARLEMRIAFQTLFGRLPNLRIVAQPKYANLYHFHGLERLMVADG